MSEPWNELLKYLETGDKSEYSKLFGGIIKLISLDYWLFACGQFSFVL